MDDNQHCSLIVNYLPAHVDDILLRELFCEYGELISANVAYNKTTGESLTYGFLRYSKAEYAAAAISGKNGYRIGNKQIKVSIAKSKCGDIQYRKLFVHNLPLSYNEKQVEDLFSQFGDIIECRLLKEADKKTSRGSAFVEFRVASDCARAVNEMHETTPPSAASNIYVYFARHPAGTDGGAPPDRPTPAHTIPMSAYQSPSAPLVVAPSLGGTLTPPPLNPVYLPSSPTYSQQTISHSPRYHCDMISPPPYSSGSAPFCYPNYIPGSVSMEESWIQVVGIPAMARLSQVTQLFESFGHITSVNLDYMIEATQTVFSGTGTVCIITTKQQISELFRVTHNHCVFPGYPPVQLFLLHH